MFFSTNYGPSSVERLLDRLEGKEVPCDPAVGGTDPVVLRDFLDEDEVVAELRADNRRLIDYLAQEHILSELIDYSLNKPVIEDGMEPDRRELQKFKYPQVASEILSSEPAKITEGIVSREELMKRIFSLLDSDDPVDAIQAANFSKILISLLRAKNAETLEAISQRPGFMLGVLRNANAAPITDIVVRVLDNPDMDRPFNNTYAEPPSREAVRLLEESDMLVGLGNVLISTVNEGSSVLPDEDRLRFERIENVATTIIGLTRRVLQLEQNHFSMPENLNVFKDPATLGSLMDAALDADLEELNWCSASRPKTEEEHSDMVAMILAMSKKSKPTVGTSPLTSPKSSTSAHREQLSKPPDDGRRCGAASRLTKAQTGRVLRCSLEEWRRDPEESQNNVLMQKEWLRTSLVRRLMSTYRNYKDKQAENSVYRNGFIGHVILIATKVEEFLRNFDYRPNKLEFLPADVLDEFEVFCEDYLAEEQQKENAPLGGERPGNSNRTGSDTDNGPDEATEVFDMGDVIGELATGESDEAMRKFTEYLFHSSDAQEFNSDDDEDSDEEESSESTENMEDGPGAGEKIDLENMVRVASGGTEDSDDDDYEQFVASDMETKRKDKEEEESGDG